MDARMEKLEKSQSSIEDRLAGIAMELEKTNKHQEKLFGDVHSAQDKMATYMEDSKKQMDMMMNTLQYMQTLIINQSKLSREESPTSKATFENQDSLFKDIEPRNFYIDHADGSSQGKSGYSVDRMLIANHFTLQEMRKGTTETLREYAVRWEKYASRIKPPLTENELSTMFVNTLKAPFFDILVTCVHKGFPALITMGERIENEQITQSEGPVMKKRKEKIATVFTPIITSTRAKSSIPKNNEGTSQKRTRERRQFAKIPMTYKRLYPILIKGELLEPRQAVPVPQVDGKYPFWYKPNEHCEYHSGGVGHSIDECLAFKHTVQNLLDQKRLNFSPVPNVTTNPLPNHGVNMVEVEENHVESDQNALDRNLANDGEGDQGSKKNA